MYIFMTLAIWTILCLRILPILFIAMSTFPNMVAATTTVANSARDSLVSLHRRGF